MCLGSERVNGIFSQYLAYKEFHRIDSETDILQDDLKKIPKKKNQ